MAPLCADNNNFMAYCLPMASSARSEASLMALAQQLVHHQQQHKQLQQSHSLQQQQPPNEPSQSVLNEWASSLQSQPEEFAVPSSGFYSDDEYDLNPSSGSFFNEPTVLDLSASTLLLPSVESHLQEPVFLYKDMGIRYNGTVDTSCRQTPAVVGLDEERFSDSFANERSVYDGNLGCRFVNPNELSQSFTGADETGDLVSGFLPSSSGLMKSANFQSMAFDSPEAPCRGDFVFVDASSEWMDCLMCDVQTEDADQLPIVSCFDMNPCESTQSSEPAVATMVHPCTPEDALPEGFTVLEEAVRCMQTHSDDVSPSWTQDTGNEVLSSPPRDLLSASSPDLISTSALKRSRVEESHYIATQGSQILQDLQRSQIPCFRQGGREPILSKDTRTYFRREEKDASIRKVAEHGREGYQVPTHGVQLMQLLLECAKTVDSDQEKARSVLPKLRALSTRSGDPIQRLGAYFTEALSKRLVRFGGDQINCEFAEGEEECTAEELTLSYKAMNEACPYFTFAQLTANQAILEAIEEAEKVHIVDFGIMEGVQWAALLQAIASKGGKTRPRVRITGIGSAELGERRREVLAATGRRLEEFGRSVDLEVEFRATEAVLGEESLLAEDLGVEEGEVVAVNFMMALCNLLGGGGAAKGGGFGEPEVAGVLQIARRLRPKVTTVAEMTAGLNRCPFEKRFVNALHFYSAMFDSLEASMRRDCPHRRRMERKLLGERIDSMVGAPEGQPRRRLQLKEEWRTSMEAAGFDPAPLSHYAVSQARILLWRFCDSFTLNEEESALCLSLGWQNKSLLTVSSWTCSPSYV